MPLVAHNDLPTFQVLQDRGQTVLSLARAKEQDIRELHIGFLNMMPDAALAATERQFIRMVGSSNPIAQFFVYPFSIPELARGDKARAHIEKYYFKFEDLAAAGLDALIITGANVINPSLDQEPFWDPLTDIMHWANNNVASVFCSCLATHALVKHYHGLDRRRLERKLWGVYSHKVTSPMHPLLRDVNTRFDAPHSRYNDISREQFESAGCHVLAESPGNGVHLAVSPDQPVEGMQARSPALYRRRAQTSSPRSGELPYRRGSGAGRGTYCRGDRRGSKKTASARVSGSAAAAVRRQHLGRHGQSNRQ